MFIKQYNIIQYTIQFTIYKTVHLPQLTTKKLQQVVGINIIHNYLRNAMIVTDCIESYSSNHYLMESRCYKQNHSFTYFPNNAFAGKILSKLYGFIFGHCQYWRVKYICVSLLTGRSCSDQC